MPETLYIQATYEPRIRELKPESCFEKQSGLTFDAEISKSEISDNHFGKCSDSGKIFFFQLPWFYPGKIVFETWQPFVIFFC